MYGVVDNEMAIQDLYNMPLLILICAVTAGFIMLLCLFYLQKNTASVVKSGQQNGNQPEKRVP